MKRSYLAGAAVVALTAWAGSASAQSKFELVVGGDAFFQAAYADEKVSNNLRSTEFSNRFRLTFTPTAKADNGLEYGARLRLRAANGNRTTDADRGFLFVNGGFGTIQAGVNTGLGDDYGVIGPNVDGGVATADGFALNFYADSLPYAMGNLRTMESADWATKLIYLTPSFSGFQAGISYTPKQGNHFTSIDRTKRSGVYADMVEAGVFYKNTFGDLALDASVEYMGADSDSSAVEDLSSVHVGATVGYGPVKVGGSYAYSGKSGYAVGARGLDKNQVWILGANYTAGAFTVAANYTDAKGGVGGYGATVNARAKAWQAGVLYAVAPGLTTALEYTYLDNKVGTRNNDANIVMVDTRLAF